MAATNGQTTLSALKVPGSKSEFYGTTQAWQKLSLALTDTLSNAAAYLRMSLPDVIVSRSQGTVDRGEAVRQARSIARDFTLAAQLQRLSARFAVRARHKYDRFVEDAAARAASRPAGKFDANA